MIVDKENILLQLNYKSKTWHDPRETSPVSNCKPMQLELQMNLPENNQIWKQQHKEELAAGRKNLSDMFDENRKDMVAVACS